MNENALLEKLVVAKKIMNRHDQTPRGNTGGNIPLSTLQNFEAPQASYNLPQEFLQEQQQPKVNIGQQINKERILNSKLPDEIKQLMIENPIVQPAVGNGPTLSDDLISKAARLMNTNAAGQTINEAPQRQPQVQNTSDNTDLKKLVKEAVKEILSESGLLVESTSKSNDNFSFRVGNHIFEGKIVKIKKTK